MQHTIHVHNCDLGALFYIRDELQGSAAWETSRSGEGHELCQYIVVGKPEPGRIVQGHGLSMLQLSGVEQTEQTRSVEEDHVER